MTDAPRYARLRLAVLAVLILGVAVAAYVTAPDGPGKPAADASPDSDAELMADTPPLPVSERGSIEVTAKLIEIRGLDKFKGRFPSNDLGYDYAYVLKYRLLEIHRGDVEGETIHVAHYNPLKLRSAAADEDRPGCEELGGNLERFRIGELHRLALEVPLDENYMGPVINPYAGQVDPTSLYWAVWTDGGIR